jgi:hypothetical protein
VTQAAWNVEGLARLEPYRTGTGRRGQCERGRPKRSQPTGQSAPKSRGTRPRWFGVGGHFCHVRNARQPRARSGISTGFQVLPSPLSSGTHLAGECVNRPNSRCRGHVAGGLVADRRSRRRITDERDDKHRRLPVAVVVLTMAMEASGAGPSAADVRFCNAETKSATAPRPSSPVPSPTPPPASGDNPTAGRVTGTPAAPLPGMVPQPQPAPPPAGATENPTAGRITGTPSMQGMDPAGQSDAAFRQAYVDCLRRRSGS